MSKKDEALKLALEALENPNDIDEYNRSKYDLAITALREALAEQPAQQEPVQADGDTIVQTFTGLPKRKLRELLSGGWEVNGVCFQRIETDGTVRRGAATTGGMVLWWNQPEQPAPVAKPHEQEPVAWRVRCTDPMRDWVLMYRHPKTEEQFSNMEIEPLYTSPPAQRTWGGLTEPERLACYDLNPARFASAIERKLKEKNNG